MPQLPTYTAGLAPAPVSGGRRAESSDFRQGDFGASGRGIQSAASALMSDFEEQEQRRALIASTEVRAEYAKKLDEAAISGAPLEPLKAEMEAKLAKVGENFATKRGSESLQIYQANNSLMFDEQANRIEVQRAGAQAKQDADKFLKNESTLIVMSGGAYLETAIKNAEALANTFTKVSPETRAVIANGLKEQLNLTAARSEVRDNPTEGLKKLEAGKWELDPDKRLQLMDYARTEQRRAIDERERVEAETKRKRAEEINGARMDIYKKIQEGKMSWATMRDDPRLQHPDAVQELEHLHNVLKARTRELQGGERKSDAVALRDANIKVMNGEWLSGAPIIDLVNKGQLNVNDGWALMNRIAQQKDASGRSFQQRLGARLASVRTAIRTNPAINADMLMDPELGPLLENELTARAFEQENRYREANDKAGLEGMLNPDSKDYFFKPGFLKQVADDVKAKKRQAVEDSLPRVNAPEDIVRLGLKEGARYIAPNGQPATLSAQTLAAVKGAAKPKEKPVEPEAPIVGTSPAADVLRARQAARAASAAAQEQARKDAEEARKRREAEEKAAAAAFRARNRMPE